METIIQLSTSAAVSNSNGRAVVQPAVAQGITTQLSTSVGVGKSNGRGVVQPAAATESEVESHVMQMIQKQN